MLCWHAVLYCIAVQDRVATTHFFAVNVVAPFWHSLSSFLFRTTFVSVESANFVKVRLFEPAVEKEATKLEVTKAWTSLLTIYLSAATLAEAWILSTTKSGLIIPIVIYLPAVNMAGVAN